MFLITADGNYFVQLQYICTGKPMLKLNTSYFTASQTYSLEFVGFFKKPSRSTASMVSSVDIWE